MHSSEAKGALKELQTRPKNGKKTGSFQNVLERLLRLRQMYVNFLSAIVNWDC